MIAHLCGEEAFNSSYIASKKWQARIILRIRCDDSCSSPNGIRCPSSDLKNPTDRRCVQQLQTDNRFGGNLQVSVLNCCVVQSDNIRIRYQSDTFLVKCITPCIETIKIHEYEDISTRIDALSCKACKSRYLIWINFGVGVKRLAGFQNVATNCPRR